MLEARRAEIALVLKPAPPQDRDRVMLAVLEMYRSFPSMRGDEMDAAANLDAMATVLEPFPAWAVERACLSIRSDGVMRNGRMDRQWPPSEGELVDVVKSNLALYEGTLRRVAGLLKAEVEP